MAAFYCSLEETNDSQLQINKTEIGDQLVLNPNPLTNHVILKTLMSFLPMSQLKVARFVCKSWNSEAIQPMREFKNNLFTFRSVKCVKKFIYVFKETIDCPIGRFKLENNILSSRVLSQLNSFGNTISHLELAIVKPYTFAKLEHLLCSTPNLQILNFRDIHQIIIKGRESPLNFTENLILPKLTKLIFVTTINNVHNEMKLEDILVNCELFLMAFFKIIPKLDSVTFNGDSTDWVIRISQCLVVNLKIQPHKRIKEINIGTQVESKILAPIQNCGFPLRKLKLKNLLLNCSADARRFEKYLESLSGTLEYLELHRKRRTADDNSIVIVLKWPFMKKLNTLRLLEDRKVNVEQNDVNILGDFVFSLNPVTPAQFPALTKLYANEQCSDIFGSNSKKILSTSLEHLELEFPNQESYYDPDWFIYLREKFPSLTKLTLQYGGQCILKNVFECMTLLEHLDIIGENGFPLVDADAVFTGISDRWCKRFLEEENKEVVVQKYLDLRDENPSICSLTRLKSLKISLDTYNENSNGKLSSVLTEATAYLALLHMNHMELLELDIGVRWRRNCLQKLESYHRIVIFKESAA